MQTGCCGPPGAGTEAGLPAVVANAQQEHSLSPAHPLIRFLCSGYILLKRSCLCGPRQGRGAPAGTGSDRAFTTHDALAFTGCDTKLHRREVKRSVKTKTRKLAG